MYLFGLARRVFASGICLFFFVGLAYAIYYEVIYIHRSIRRHSVVDKEAYLASESAVRAYGLSMGVGVVYVYLHVVRTVNVIYLKSYIAPLTRGDNCRVLRAKREACAIRVSVRSDVITVYRIVGIIIK